MDMATSCRAEYLVSNPYEKRFHLKNIQASISEGFKLLFNFGKQRRKSLWTLLMNRITEDGNSELLDEGQKIQERLEVFGDSEIDQELRDLTLHYDKEMIEVYKMTVSVNSEEKVMIKACHFWFILQDVLLFTRKVDDICFSQTGINKPSRPTTIQLSIKNHRLVSLLLNKDCNLEDVFNNLPKGTVESIDLMAEQWNTIKQIEDFIHDKTPDIDVIPEIKNIQVLTNIQLLLRFMMLDLVAIVNAYLKSSSDIEYSLNLRRICVTKVSTIVHLYGYNEEEHEQSIWKQLEDIVPVGASERLECEKIDRLLKNFASNSSDKDLRATFVHLFDNSKACSNINEVITSIEDIDPVAQVVEIQSLLKIYRLLMPFLSALMDILVKEAHEMSVKSNNELNDQLDEAISRCENSELPDNQKKQFIDKMIEMKRIINDTMFTNEIH